MISAYCLAVLVSCGAQEGDLVGAGQRYFDKVARIWEERAPIDHLLGVYVGRKWVGYARVAVRRGEPKSDAPFEVTTKGEITILGKTMRYESRAHLDARLTPIRVDSSAEEWKGKITKRLTVEGGRWKRVIEEGGAPAVASGALAPATTWDASILPIFAPPDDADCATQSLDSDKGAQRFIRAPGKKVRTIGGAPVECSVLELRTAETAPDSWYYDPSGRMVELRPAGMPFRMVFVTEPEFGKDRDEPLVLNGPLKVLVECFLARKRGDRERTFAAFDLEQFARESVPEFDEFSAENKRKVFDALRERLAGQLLSKAMRDALPEEHLMEDFLAASSETVEREGVAEVGILGRQIWRLHRVRGQWRIIGFREQ